MYTSTIPEPVLILDREPVRSRLPFTQSRKEKENQTMPNMTLADFIHPIPVNAEEIMQFINSIILCHEESIFWDNDPAATEQWERNLISRYLAGDRSGHLVNAPEPIYKEKKPSMTTEDLALHMIEHADSEPTCISLEESKRFLSHLSKPLPSDCTPDSFMKAWNSIILFDMPEIWK